MTITVSGVPLYWRGDKWTRYHQGLGDLGAGAGVLSGLAVSIASGTRMVTVTSGASIQAGTLLESDAAVTFQLPLSTASRARICTVCAQVDWSGSPNDDVDISATAGSLVGIMGGTGGKPPALAQTPWSSSPKLFQTPLFDVLIPAGAAAQLTGSLTDRRLFVNDSAAVSFGGNWATNSNYPLMLRRTGNVVELSGRTARANNTLSATDSTTFTIPRRFWPRGIAHGICTTGGDALNAPAFAVHRLEVDTDGTATFRAGSTPISIGTNLRIDMTWIGA